jgi:hypothetical protein
MFIYPVTQQVCSATSLGLSVRALQKVKGANLFLRVDFRDMMERDSREH